MPFLDHLEELRWRILYSLLAIAVGTAGGWLLVQHVDVIELLKRPIAQYLPNGRLVFTSPTEPFLLTLKVAFAVGLVVASPVVIYHIWAFLAPALFEHEKRLIMPALSVGVVLFLIGAVAAYLWVLPAALRVLFSFQRQDLAPVITIDRYFGFAVPFVLAFGAVTELPLVVAILAALGLVTPQFLSRNRRYALVVSAFVAALLTPPDAVSMMMMLVPLLLLYEISIWCAWVASRRRERRQAAASAALLALLLALGGAGGLAAQGKPTAPPPRRAQQPDTSRRTVPDTLRGRQLDTATARKLGLPTGPTRSFPEADSVIDSLLKLQGYRVTRYVADTLVVHGDSQTMFLRGAAFVDREGTKLEADSIRYHEPSCRLDAAGDPRLFDQGTVLIGDGMRYDTCVRRGIVVRALTDFQQGGATWYMRGDLAVDSGSTRVFGSGAEITSCDLPVPDYHFTAREVKWLNKNVMVARPAVLYIRDVPVMWLPFVFQDIRSGRRSGILVPRFGLNDLVRPTRNYRRHLSNLGYYFVLNNYMDLLVSGDWFAGRNLAFRAQTRYRWLDRFVQGGLSYTRTVELGEQASATTLSWYHNQSFDSRTHFSANVNYTTSARVVQRNTLDPFVATAAYQSSLNFDKRFSWGTFTVGGSRSQDLSKDLVQQNFPQVRLTPSAVNIGSWMTWSPTFSYNNQQSFHQATGSPLLVPGAGGVVDTLQTFFDNRTTSLNFGTPLRFWRWNWTNSFDVLDLTSNQRQEFLIRDSTAPGGVRRVLYGSTFRTEVNWTTGINLPPLLTGTFKIQPSLGILNTTTAGPYMLRNQFTGGRFLRQGKRFSFSAGMSPTLFAFFPGLGPLARIRHSFSPIVSYLYAPGAKVSDEFARAIDPTGRTLNAKSDPQQTISLGFSQNFEAKLKPAPGDTGNAPPRKIKLLSINTSPPISYNFEQAKDSGRTGWTTQTLTNTFASDLLPNFSLSVSHDLWRGAVGLDTAKFDPFLTSVSASFQVSPQTFRSLAALFGLGGGKAPPPPPPTPQPGAAPPPPGPGFGGPSGKFPGAPGSGAAAMAGAGGGGGGFSLNISYSSSRTRPIGPPAPGSLVTKGGLQQVNLSTSFSPTTNWTASWNTSYDFGTRQFSAHYIRLERNLHRWHASFQFVKSPNGNVGFNFYVSLLDMPDIKFDYDQQTLVRP